MATFIVLGNFTDLGIRNVKDTIKRAEAFRAAAKKLGVTVKDLYWTMGQFDIAAIVEASDETAVATLGLGVGSTGNVRTQILRAFTESEIGPILGRLA